MVANRNQADGLALSSPSAINRRTFFAASAGGLLGLLFASRSSASPAGRARSCILLRMNGGPSHLDTWDPKPGTLAGGPFRAIGTSAPGVRICERLPQMAEQANRLAIVRGMTASDGNHRRACRLVYAGFPPAAPLFPGLPALRYHGALTDRLAGACDLRAEPASVRAAYGHTLFGRGCLAARRLVEAGAAFVEVTLDGWDTHEDHFTRTAALLRVLDPAMASLIRELHERGLLGSTLVVWLGEFGRTPTLNRNEGRDHHPAAWSAVLAGAGIRQGIAYGETDATGEQVDANPVTVPGLLATVAALRGMPLAPAGSRPVKALMS